VVQPDHVIDVSQAPYYAKFDGTTDDTTAIQRALDDALLVSGTNVGGAIVECPAGVAMLSSRLVVGEKSGAAFGAGRVIFRGQGKRVTELKATAGFTFNGSTDSMVRIGAGLGANMHDVRIEQMDLNCNNVAGSIGLYSTNCQEGSGPRRVVVTNFKVKGMFFSTSGCQNFSIRECETYHTSTTAIGIDMPAGSYGNEIDDVTINSNNATQSTNPGIRLDSGSCVITRPHFEYHTTGIHLQTNAHALILSPVGHATVTDLIKSDQNGWAAFNINAAGSAFSVNDTVSGIGQVGAMNDGGYYISGNEGSGATTRDIWQSSNTAVSRKAGPVNFLGLFTASGGVTLSSTLTATTGLIAFGAPANLASATTVALPATGQFFLLTGTTTIDNFSGGVAGTVYTLIAGTGTITVRDKSASSGNIINNGGVNRTMTANTKETHVMIFDGTEYVELSHSTN
jgi:hypothetical protein